MKKQILVPVAILSAILASHVFAADPTAGAAQPSVSAPSQRGGWSPEKQQARFEKHMADLKIRLQISTSQEAAWTTFHDAIQPPAERPASLDPRAMEKLSTPERIDAIRKIRAQVNSTSEHRESATKAFYAALTAPQQKVFDLETLRFFQPRHHAQWWHHHGQQMESHG